MELRAPTTAVLMSRLRTGDEIGTRDGSVTRTVVPTPGVLRRSNSPSWLTTMPRAILRPSPVPFALGRAKGLACPRDLYENPHRSSPGSRARESAHPSLRSHHAPRMLVPSVLSRIEHSTDTPPGRSADSPILKSRSRRGPERCERNSATSRAMPIWGVLSTNRERRATVC